MDRAGCVRICWPQALRGRTGSMPRVRADRQRQYRRRGSDRRDRGYCPRDAARGCTSDAAFGLWAATSESTPGRLVAGIERSRFDRDRCPQVDSCLTTRAWFFTAHPEAHQQSLDDAGPLHADHPRRTRARGRSRPTSRVAPAALPLYAALRSLGRSGIRDLVDRCCALAQRMASRLGDHDHVRILNDVVLNQVLVQFGAPRRRRCEQPRRLTTGGDRAGAGGRLRAGPVERDGMGRPAMRISISNWTTTPEDINRSAAAILSALDDARRDAPS